MANPESALGKMVKAIQGRHPDYGDGEHVPAPTTIEQAWDNFQEVMLAVTNVPEESYLFPLVQDMVEEVGIDSLQMNDGRETLGNLHGIEIPAEPDKTKWPRTVEDMFRKYLGYTPAAADLTARPDHPIFSRQT